jgi:hypothetical protein
LRESDKESHTDRASSIMGEDMPLV